MSQKFIKNGFDWPENLFPLTGMQNSFKASSGRVVWKWKKKWFPLAEKWFPTSKNKVVFRKLPKNKVILQNYGFH